MRLSFGDFLKFHPAGFMSETWKIVDWWCCRVRLSVARSQSEISICTLEIGTQQMLVAIQRPNLCRSTLRSNLHESFAGHGAETLQYILDIHVSSLPRPLLQALGRLSSRRKLQGNHQSTNWGPAIFRPREMLVCQGLRIFTLIGEGLSLALLPSR